MKKTSVYLVAAVLLGILTVATPLTIFPETRVFHGESERKLPAPAPAPMEESSKEVQDYSEFSSLERLVNLGLLIGAASTFAFLVFFYAKFHVVK